MEETELKKSEVFVISPIGLEMTLIRHLNYLIRTHERDVDLGTVEYGGVTVFTTFDNILFLNQNLKIANRLLLRVASFKARDLPKLFNKLKKIDFSQLISNSSIEIKVSSSKSRLINTSKIKETCQNALDEYFKAKPPKKANLNNFNSHIRPSLFVRLVDDNCTISLDTSGERLGMRGLKENSIIAPIRENIMAGLLFDLKEFSKGKKLFDPMAGSGTSIIENTFFYSTIESRDYSILGFPSYLNLNFTQKLPDAFPLFEEQLCSDISDHSVEACNNNFKKCKIKTKAKLANFFNHCPKEEGITLFINPPYDKRIKLKDSNAFFEDIANTFLNKSQYTALGVILPIKHFKMFLMKMTNLKSQSYEFQSGGLSLHYLMVSK